MRIGRVVFVVLAAFFPFTSFLSAIPLVYEGDFNQRIPAGAATGKAWMEPVQLQVPEHFVIDSLTVSLTIIHQDVSDLQIFLESPTGLSIQLKNDWPLLWRQDRPNMTGTVFDDAANTYLFDALPPYTGTFLPEAGNYLSAFAGEDASGLWTLKIYDCNYDKIGTLDHWELRFEHTPEPGGLLILGVGVVLGRIRLQKTARGRKGT